MSADYGAYLYHTTPLHYLPHILRDGALYAQSILAAQNIQPRATAERRARMLGLTNWVHLSLQPHSPLLTDKLSKGYCHVLLCFHRAAVLTLPETALLPYNLKAWRSRAACLPITDPEEKKALLRRHAQTGRYPSLEVLAHYGLGLSHLAQIAFLTKLEQEAAVLLSSALELVLPAPFVLDASLFPPHTPNPVTTLPSVTAYFDACIRAETLLPPPAIPFD